MALPRALEARPFYQSAWQRLEEDLGRGLLDELAARQDRRLTPAERGQLRDLTTELEQLESKERTTAQTKLEQSMNRLEDYVDELSEVGCELKDYQVGLIDFIGRHQTRDVYLCWKLGEEQIAYWHEMNAGYAGRQPVASLKETA